MRIKATHTLVYSVITIIVLFGSIELTTRTISWLNGNGFTLSLHELDPYDRKIRDLYQWHPFTGFMFQPSIKFLGSHPNQETKAEIFTDKYGFLTRDQGLGYGKPPNEIRIACIGGSTTANVNLEFGKNWPGYLGSLLQKNFPNINIRVINAGTPGFDTGQSIANLALRVMPFKPDIVIIYHAYNDLKAIRPDRPFRPDYSHIHTTPYGFHKEPNLLIKLLNKSMFYVRTRNKYREYKNADNKTLQFREPLEKEKRVSSVPQKAVETFEQNIRSLASIASAGGAKVVFATFATLHDPKWDWSTPETLKLMTSFQRNNLNGLKQFTPGLTIEGIFNGLSQYNNVLKKVAGLEKYTLVDNSNLIPHEDEYFVDRVHLSDLGAKHMAENLYPEVVRLLQSANLPKLKGLRPGEQKETTFKGFGNSERK